MHGPRVEVERFEYGTPGTRFSLRGSRGSMVDPRHPVLCLPPAARCFFLSARVQPRTSVTLPAASCSLPAILCQLPAARRRRSVSLSSLLRLLSGDRRLYRLNSLNQRGKVIASRPLPAALCSPPAARCLLPAASCSLSFSPVARCRLLVGGRHHTSTTTRASQPSAVGPTRS